MAKVAKLVYVYLVTRVIVDETASETEIMELAVPKLTENIAPLMSSIIPRPPFPIKTYPA